MEKTEPILRTPWLEIKNVTMAAWVVRPHRVKGMEKWKKSDFLCLIKILKIEKNENSVHVHDFF
jgi:hypothetical protein